MITKYPYCVFCGKPMTQEHHLIGGHGFRTLCDEDELTIPTCDNDHDPIHLCSQAMTLSKIAGQLAFEKHWVAKGDTEDEARERFRKRYGRSWL